jgi:hypothetical protein
MTTGECPQAIASFDTAWKLQRQAFVDALRVRGHAPATVVARSQALGTFFAWLTETAIIEIFHVTQDLLTVC